MDMLANISTYGNSAVIHIKELSIASLVLILTTGALFLFALRYGKDRIIAFIFALYVGMLAFLHFPYTEKVLLFKGSEINVLLSHSIIYIAFVILIYIVTERVIWAEYPQNGARRLMEAFILALSGAALLLSFAYNILPIASFYSFSPTIELIFEPSKFFFWWLLFPLVAVFLLARR